VAALVALPTGCGSATEAVRFSCPGDPKLGVYSPERLKVLAACRWVRGTVMEVERKDDGDLHLLVRPAPGFFRFLNVTNVNNGGLVVEIMLGQRLARPAVGERLAIMGTWVYDTHNDWNEIHPVWGFRYLDRGTAAFDLPSKRPRYDGDRQD
jgi:hypothetical protein